MIKKRITQSVPIILEILLQYNQYDFAMLNADRLFCQDIFPYLLFESPDSLNLVVIFVIRGTSNNRIAVPIRFSTVGRRKDP